jgi:flagellar hook-basal body complex protein FliE
MKEIALTYAPPVAATRPATAAPSGQPQGKDFQTHLKQALGDVNELTQQADQAIRQLIGEGKGDLQETIVAMEKADVSFRLMMQIRNKILEAYQEIVRMQV